MRRCGIISFSSSNAFWLPKSKKNFLIDMKIFCSDFSLGRLISKKVEFPPRIDGIPIFSWYKLSSCSHSRLGVAVVSWISSDEIWVLLKICDPLVGKNFCVFTEQRWARIWPATCSEYLSNSALRMFDKCLQNKFKHQSHFSSCLEFFLAKNYGKEFEERTSLPASNGLNLYLRMR